MLRASILQPMQSGSNADKLNARLDVSRFDNVTNSFKSDARHDGLSQFASN
jgi:hypothetical protein